MPPVSAGGEGESISLHTFFLHQRVDFTELWGFRFVEWVSRQEKVPGGLEKPKGVE